MGIAVPTPRAARRRASLLLALGTVAPLRAEPAAAGESPAPEPSPRLELHASLHLYYAWNDGDPAAGESFYPGYGNSGRRANEPAVDLVAVELALPPAPLGFQLTAATGDAMELLKSGEPDATPDAFDSLYRASISYLPPAVPGLRVEAGLYPSHIGFESPLPKDNWSYTQGWVGNLTPSYQTGVQAAYAFTDAVAGELHLVNGWQITADNNDRPSLGAKLAWTPARGSLALAAWRGPELPGDDRTLRTLLDLVATLRPAARLRLAAELIAGRQERPAPDRRVDSWTILAAWARVELTARSALAARLERVEDGEGAISGHAQTLSEATLTFDHRPRPELTLRLEGRHDRSSAPVFDDDGEGRDRQTLLLAAAIVAF